MATTEAKIHTPSAITALKLFKDFLNMRLGVTSKEVREEYEGVACYEQERGRSFWDHFPEGVAQCVALGLHPKTGGRLEDPEKFITGYNRPDMYTGFASKTRTSYEALRKELISKGLFLSGS